MSNVLQTSLTPSKRSSTQSHISNLSLKSQKKRLGLKHSPILETFEPSSTSQQKDVSQVEVGHFAGLNNKTGLPDV
jgi:sensor domain CHASE-containing protein